MARYLLNAFLAACIVTVAVSTQSRRNMEQKTNTRRQYTSGYVYCMDFMNHVHSSEMCDGKSDCIDGSDEMYCAGGHGEGKVQCLNLMENVNSIQMCDGINDCTDGSDEWYCAVQCTLDMTFVHSYQWCDGMVDCQDGSDEWFCEATTYYPPASGYTESPLGPATTYYPPASGYTDSPYGPGTGSTTFENCQCTCSSPGTYWKKSIKARGLKTQTNGNQKTEKEQQEPKTQFMKKSHKTKNYLEHLLRAMKAKQLRKEQK